MESENNIQYYLINENAQYNSNKFKYKLDDIQLETFTNQIKDEEMRDVILKNDLKKYDDEKEKLLYDLSLLENFSEMEKIYEKVVKIPYANPVNFKYYGIALKNNGKYKEAKNYLSKICNKIIVSPGQATSNLRQKWGMNNILNDENQKTREDHRFKESFSNFSFLDSPELTFQQADRKKFRNLALAYSAMEKAGNMPAILNAANEVSVEAYLNDQIHFTDIARINEATLHAVQSLSTPVYEDFVHSDEEARAYARGRIK
mgnify:CR=1 FL=1